MSLRRLLRRIVLVALFTWIVGSIVDSFWTALIWALIPIWFVEITRPRPEPESQPTPTSDE